MRGFRGITLPASGRMRPGWIAASLVAHAALVALLLRAYSGFRDYQAERRAAALFTVVALPAPSEPNEAPPPVRRARPLVAPTSVPTINAASVPVPDEPTEAGADTAGVPGSRGRGAARLTPHLADRRLYARPLYIPEGGGRPISMDSVVRGRMLAMADQLDSLMLLDSMGYRRNPYATPSWVVERDGKKWGIDQQGIHLGTFSIPTAVLALLPFPQGNIDQARANARIADMRSEILRAAARSEAEDDFRRAVKQIRERRERERTEQRDRERRRAAEERPIN